MPDDPDPALAQTAVTLDPGTSLASGPQPEPAQVIADRYEVQTLLGVGGMGRVYRAFDRSLDEVVALKLLRRDLVGAAGVVERFRQEVKLARRVTDVHVVRMYDLGQHESDHFLTMEYIDGRSLARVLEEGSPPVREALRIAREVCAGICAAHAAGVLHRDLKPDNVLVASSGRIAITDFGIARPSGQPTETIDRFAGTPAYMAPEQVDGRAAIGAYTDVYAFGAMLFEMLTGRRAWVGGDAMQVAVARLTQPPPDPRPLRALPEPLAALVVRCMAREPADRFADAAALRDALAAIDDSAQMSLSSLPQPIVPAKSSIAIAVLPLRAGAEHAEIAGGLTEEIVDALAMTRSLRVRPLAAVRRAMRDDLDARELGAQLGVDVVVDGALRGTGEKLRLSARATGVADGFQLWADRFETRPERLLDASDEVARAVARALTVELTTPARGQSDPRATALYLEGKAKLRTGWYTGDLAVAMRDLEAAHALAPDDAGVLAAVSLALSRRVFYGSAGVSDRALALAQRAAELAPDAGESWLALGTAAHYANQPVEAARAVMRAVSLGPGIAQAQAAVGAMALEAGMLDEGIAHLEAAYALEPLGQQASDLARGYVYSGRVGEAFALLGTIKDSVVIVQSQIARFKAWFGELYDFDPSGFSLPGDIHEFATTLFRIHRKREMRDEDRELFHRLDAKANARLRSSRAQFAAELLVFTGDHAAALAEIERSVDAGLYDTMWFQRCPALVPLHGDAKFDELARIVADRAALVQAALRGRR